VNEPRQFEIRNQRDDLIANIDEWLKFAPPKRGKRQWKDFRSAKELARSFFRSGGPEPPTELLEFLKRLFGGDVSIQRAVPECVIRLDDFAGEHRNCDLVLYGSGASETFVVNIEAKADEPFSELTGEYYDRMLGTSSNVPKRISNLAGTLFGQFDDRVRRLRYQLLHAAVAAVKSAQACDAPRVALVVWEFTSADLNAVKIEKNRRDWANFVRALLDTEAIDGVDPYECFGPIRLPNLTTPDLYLGHLITTLPGLSA
jgi:hypothetical protein